MGEKAEGSAKALAGPVWQLPAHLTPFAQVCTQASVFTSRLLIAARHIFRRRPGMM